MPQSIVYGLLLETASPQVGDKPLEPLPVLWKTGFAAMPLQVLLQEVYVASFFPDEPYHLLCQIRIHFIFSQSLENLQWTPAILLHPAKSKIIRVFGIVEKVQLFEAIEHGFNLFRSAVAAEFLPQLSPTVGSPGQDPARAAQQFF